MQECAQVCLLIFYNINIMGKLLGKISISTGELLGEIVMYDDDADV